MMPETKKRPKVIVSALIEKDGKYLLSKETLESGRDLWIVPGGKVEFSETLEAAVKREMKEELGIEIEIVGLIDFKEALYPQYGYHTVIFFFHAKPKSGKVKLEEKIIEAKYHTPEELKNLELVDNARWVLEKLEII